MAIVIALKVSEADDEEAGHAQRQAEKDGALGSTPGPVGRSQGDLDALDRRSRNPHLRAPIIEVQRQPVGIQRG
jgi:hypothetical protein